MARTRRLAMTLALRHDIEQHARRSLPEEACGVLLGESDGVAVVAERAVAAENVHPADRRRRYRIDPEWLLGVQKGARDEGLEIVGYYHSHPDAPARPSTTDLQDAWPHLSYVILSLAHDELRSWSLDPDDGTFTEETLSIEGTPAVPE